MTKRSSSLSKRKAVAALAAIAGAAAGFLLSGLGGAATEELEAAGRSLVPPGATVTELQRNEGSTLIVGRPFAVVRYSLGPGETAAQAAATEDALGAAGWDVTATEEYRGGTQIVAEGDGLKATVAALSSGDGSIRVEDPPRSALTRALLSALGAAAGFAAPAVVWRGRPKAR